MTRSDDSRPRIGAAMAAGLTILGVLILIAIIVPMTPLWDAATKLTPDASLPPSVAHPLGTDDFGRDNVARALAATRLTLLMTLSATAVSIVGGVIAGVGVWLLPARPRQAVLRLIDTGAAYPALIFALVIASILGSSAQSAVIAIGLAGIPSFARLMSNLTAGISTREYVATARFLGVGPLRIALRHVLPNMAEPLLVLSATVFALSLVELSALSFIGLGVQSPEFDFGRILNDSLTAMYVQPYQAVAASVLIVLTGLSAMLIGDALAARANPRSLMKFRRIPQPPSARVTSVVSPDAELPDAALTGAVPPSAAAAAAGPLVRVSGLSIRVPQGAELVRDVSFEIEHGQVVALVGESGSGKSLTAMAIAGLQAEGLETVAEELSFAGMDMLRKPRRQRLAREMAIVYQDPGTTFNPAMRMGPQLTEVLRVYHGMRGPEYRSTMTRALETVGIDDAPRRMKQRPHEFSGGMRQRAMIAAAMSTHARLLIADEPTTALDVTVQLQVLRQIRRAHQREHMSMLFISHDLSVVQEISDLVLVMKDGEIVERLTAGELRRREVTHPYTQRLLAAVPALSAATRDAMADREET